jgi:DNA mismatch endonuclease (patch repair protein)
MQANRWRDTGPERELRTLLHRLGYRYRVNLPIPAGRRRRADIAFTRKKVAVFIDGCYWHGCPIHASWPKTNSEFWRQKIEANKIRDHETDELLARAGWRVVRAWEHQDPAAVASMIASILDPSDSRKRDTISVPLQRKPARPLASRRPREDPRAEP